MSHKYIIPYRILVSFWPLILLIPHMKVSLRHFLSCLWTTPSGPNHKWPCHRRQFGLGQELLVKIENSLLGLHPGSLCLFSFFWGIWAWWWHKPKGMLVQKGTTSQADFFKREGKKAWSWGGICSPSHSRERWEVQRAEFPHRWSFFIPMWTPNWLNSSGLKRGTNNTSRQVCEELSRCFPCYTEGIPRQGRYFLRWLVLEPSLYWLSACF